MDLFYIAALNIFRNYRRSAITILSVAVGCAALACFGAFINFTFEGLRETTIRTQLGHLQIYADGYAENHVADPWSVMIHDVDRLEEVVENIAGVSTVTHRVSFSGIGSTGQSSVNMSVIGVDPVREVDFADFEIVVKGRNLLPGDTETGVLGVELAQGLGAEIGDWVTVLTTSRDNIINAVDFQVIGIVRTGSTEYDSVFAKVPSDLVQRAMDTTAVERVVVMLNDTADLPKIRPQIEAAIAALPEAYEIRQWDDLADFYDAVVSLYNGLFRIFAGIIAIVVMFSVANTMTMAVFERTGESAALRAIGATRGITMRMFLFEGIIIGLIGSSLGVLLSWLIASGIDVVGGISMPPPPSMSQGYQAYLKLTPNVLAIGFAVAGISTLVSSIYPAWVASRANIVEALQKQ